MFFFGILFSRFIDFLNGKYQNGQECKWRRQKRIRVKKLDTHVSPCIPEIFLGNYEDCITHIITFVARTSERGTYNLGLQILALEDPPVAGPGAFGGNWKENPLNTRALFATMSNDRLKKYSWTLVTL